MNMEHLSCRTYLADLFLPSLRLSRGGVHFCYAMASDGIVPYDCILVLTPNTSTNKHHNTVRCEDEAQFNMIQLRVGYVYQQRFNDS
jgi:hypothetical protein